jgi:hypothetical protein
MTKPIIKYDSKGNMIYRKSPIGTEYWYNENGNIIHFKNPYEYEYWCEYDKHNYKLFYLDTKDLLYWKKYPFFEEDHNTILFK